MTRSFFPRLALDGIRKNRLLYIPYLLTCVGTVMMFYIVSFLAASPLILEIRGGRNLALLLSLGQIVIALFALIFLFYTHSFLIRRRSHEFGLYSVLGMTRGNIRRILFWETLITLLVSLGAGLMLGVLFSKLAELFMVRVMRGTAVSYSLLPSLSGIVLTAVLFTVIFAVILLFSLARVQLSSPIRLLQSEHDGEKPPRARGLIALIGVIMLGAAYYLAVTVENPISALMMFFVAVLLVILATYLLFIAGSVALCRLLQRSRRYYYRADHFVAVSSMSFRMKRNGAGLASICILITMVLVMLSSTSCMYIGAEDAIMTMYPHDITVTMRQNDSRPLDALDSSLDALLTAYEPHDRLTDTFAELAGLLLPDGTLVLDKDTWQGAYSYDDLVEVYIHDIVSYTAMTGETVTLGENEILCASSSPFPAGSFTVQGGETRLVRRADAVAETSLSGIDAVKCYNLFVRDLRGFIAPLLETRLTNGMSAAVLYHTYNVDFGVSDQSDVNDLIREHISSVSQEFNLGYVTVFGQFEVRDDFYSTYCGLFFLGILLSIVFVCASILLIYYKQICEGYEDRGRFAIMQKVGMTQEDIRRSIRSQMRTVFFAPLLMAGMHLAFAFPMIAKLLQLLGIMNTPLLIRTNLIGYAVFAIVYCLIYRATSGTYLKIVSQRDV